MKLTAEKVLQINNLHYCASMSLKSRAKYHKVSVQNIKKALRMRARLRKKGMGFAGFEWRGKPPKELSENGKA